MSEEEKKAIENLKANIKIFNFTEDEIILKIIDKQQKELEQQKEENRKLRNCHLRYEEMTGIDLLLEE